MLAWLFDAAFGYSSTPFGRRSVIVLGWLACLADAVLLGLHLLIYAKIRHPFTYRLFQISDNFRGIEGSIPESLAPARAAVLSAILGVVVLSEGMWHFAPEFLTRIRITFKSPQAVVGILIFGTVGYYGANRWVTYPPAAVSSGWALVSSFFYDARPFVADSIPPEYFDDFHPVSDHSHLAAIGGAAGKSSRRPMNVLMVVMESVGARKLQLYGAPFKDSPNMMRLAQHGVRFERIYAAEAFSSSAMAGLFCAIYPNHDWMSVTRMAPNLAVDGLGGTLLPKGYRTTLMSPVPLVYDKDSEFLLKHGFHEVIDTPHRTTQPKDSELIADAIQWIKKAPLRPFFLALWMTDTHHPYLTPPVRDYQVGDPYLNRYLNGVEASDRLIGHLAQELDSMGLADDTLLVVTGDHGEAFGEHQETGHGFTIYDEEVHVPLLIVNPRLFPQPRVVHSLGR